MKQTLRKIGAIILSSPSLAIGVCTNSIVLIGAIPFLSVPRGTSIRPMGWAFLIFVVAVVSFSFGTIAAIWEQFKGQAKLGLIGFFLCLGPFPLASLLLRFLAHAKGFSLSE